MFTFCIDKVLLMLASVEVLEAEAAVNLPNSAYPMRSRI